MELDSCLEGTLFGQLKVWLSVSFTFIALAQVKLWKTNYYWNISPSHFFIFIYCACADEAVEGQLSGQLEVCLSLIYYISFFAHAQVKLWKANYLDN
jgi:hypothetical protein